MLQNIYKRFVNKSSPERSYRDQGLGSAQPTGNENLTQSYNNQK